jgi:hypothetical protein
MLILLSGRLLFAILMIPLIVGMDAVNNIFDSSVLLTAKYARDPPGTHSNQLTRRV